MSHALIAFGDARRRSIAGGSFVVMGPNAHIRLAKKMDTLT
ncbi:hypothetical protein [Caulobacter sp.]